jgi:Ca2+-binding RTX toxin-like protein
VHLSGGSELLLSDTDGIAGADTALGIGNGSPSSPENSVLVDIAGPVARIEIIHENVGSGGSAVNISDIYFDTIGAENVGDDYLEGGRGDDTIYGDGGNDTLVGGEGADMLYGGAGKDVLKANLGDTVADGGSAGNDYDILDLSGQGLIRVVNLSVDGNGNGYNGTVQFLNADGSVNGTLDFTEIEEIKGEYYNGAPVANDDSLTTDEDNSASINVLANDSDPEGGPLTVVSASAEHGVVTIGPDGKLTYTPDPDYNGEDTITYVIEDDHGNQDTAEVGVTVTPVNDLPVATDDDATTNEDEPIVIEVLGNDSDVDGDPLTVTSASAGHGTVTIGADGKLTYTPDPDWNGTDTITYEISDGNGGTDSATVTVTVCPVNDAPVAVDDVANVDYGTPAVISVLLNDYDVDGDPLSINGVPTALHGTVTVNADGTLTYTPDAGYSGPDTISYEISDGQGGYDTAIVDVEVGASPLDGIVEGTAGNDLIDYDYLGDPEGDRVDHNDEILPGQGPNDDIIEAYGGDDTVYAGAGNDTVYGGDGNDTLHGGNGNDAIFGGDGSDTVYGGDGDDVIDTDAPGIGLPDRGYPGLFPGDSDPYNDRDIVNGGNGNDTIFTGDDNDTIYGGTGDDTIDGGVDDDYIEGGTGEDNIIGGEGSDTIYGGDDDDVIWGGLGPDLPDALNIRDDMGDLRPDNGRDLIYGGAGNDRIYGQDDDDTIYGGAGDDHIDGGIDDDEIYGDAGNDTILGGQGDDYLNGGEGDDIIYGGIGNDDIQGHAGNDTLYGGDGDDNVKGSLGDDMIYGGAGNDDLEGANGNDHLYGEEGDDRIRGGQDQDVIYGGAGNDHVTADSGDDLIYGGDGDDLIYGDAGNDEIYGDAGADTIDGGEGDDYLNGGEGDDTIYGGAGNDDIQGHAGNDTLYGGEGDDNVKGSLGDDMIYGGAGNDDLEGANGNDHLYGEEGDDRIRGGQDNDTIYGGTGNDYVTADFGDDVIHGGEGDDILKGDAGKDTFYGGDGADQMYGEDDEDTFIGGTAGDFVDGGEGAQPGHSDYDVLDLSGAGPLHIIYDPDNAENGIVEFRDALGNVTGTMEFKNIENVIPCFTPGTLIATPKGERPVEDLKAGDKIITRDNGIQEIRWLGTKELDWRALGTQPHLKPILIRKGSLGHGLPERDMLVSPNHRVLVANDQTQLYFEEREVLVAAKHLVNNAGVSVAESLGTTYVHFMFDHHEVVLSDGAWTESFQPGDYTLKGIGNAQRSEILSLFPDLKDQQGIEGYASARRTLKKHEAQMLWK